MTTFRNRSIRRWSAGLVLALAGAGIGVTALANEGHRGGPPMGIGAMGLATGGRMLERMLDTVKASDEQRTQIRKIADAAANDLKAQRETSRATHDQGMQLFAQPTVDASAAEALRQQMLAQHDQASRRMLQAMLEIGQVLTPEQRAQLAQQAKERAERHRHGRDGGGPRR